MPRNVRLSWRILGLAWASPLNDPNEPWGMVWKTWWTSRLLIGSVLVDLDILGRNLSYSLSPCTHVIDLEWVAVDATDLAPAQIVSAFVMEPRASVAYLATSANTAIPPHFLPLTPRMGLIELLLMRNRCLRCQDSWSRAGSFHTSGAFHNGWNGKRVYHLLQAFGWPFDWEAKDQVLSHDGMVEVQDLLRTPEICHQGFAGITELHQCSRSSWHPSGVRREPQLLTFPTNH